MAYVLVTADFPGVTADQRNKIYDCLKEKKWKKVVEPVRDVSTAWYAGFVEDATEAGSIATAISDFDGCGKPYDCTPKLVIHWGPSKPTFRHLV